MSQRAPVNRIGTPQPSLATLRTGNAYLADFVVLRESSPFEGPESATGS